MKVPVFRNCKVLTRIRIHNSYHWISDPDPALFFSGFYGANKKINFFCKIFCSFLTLVFKDNKIFKSHKTVGNPGFS
jgi:hypothetical protein